MPSEMLRGLATLAYALQETGVGLSKFGRLYVDRNAGRSDPSGLEKRWASGKVVPTRTSFDRLERRLPGIKLMPVYSHPLFDVLLDQPQSNSRERAILHKLFSSREESSDLLHGLERADVRSDRIVRRGFWEMGQMEVLDLFTVILLLVRNLERLERPRDHVFLCHNVYDCFPYAASVTFLHPHRRLLAHCVDRVHQRSPISYELCKIDWPLLFERATTIFQLRTSGAGHEQIRAYHEAEALSAWSWTVLFDDAADRPDDVPPESLIEERWWSGSAMERAVQSAKPA